MTKGIIIQRGFLDVKKGKILPITATRAQKGSKCITILYPNLGTGLRMGVTSTLRPFCPREEPHCPLDEAGWAAGPGLEEFKEEIIPRHPTGTELWSVQPVASRYMDCFVPNAMPDMTCLC